MYASKSTEPPVNIALKYGEAAERTTLWAGKSSCLTSSITSLDMQKVMSSSLALRSSRSLLIAEKLPDFIEKSKTLSTFSCSSVQIWHKLLRLKVFVNLILRGKKEA
uniref:Uncharacterized protein n=1 Tax=Glossina pallidipes TaxID=7398 RepID=A0A1A9ZM97_GLOPL